MNKKGWIFGFEGSNGCGKTTAILNVKKSLEALYPDRKILQVRFPGETAMGMDLRKILLDAEYSISPLAEFLLFSADNTQTWSQVVEPALEEGAIILSDRTFLSSIVFQGLGLGVDRHLIRDVTLAGMERTYDTVFVLDIDLKAALDRVGKRSGSDRIEDRDLDFMTRTHQHYSKLHIHFPEWNIERINANLRPEWIASLICGAIHDTIQQSLEV